MFRAGIWPRTKARRLSAEQVQRLWRSIREVLAEAIEFGSTIPLSYAGTGRQDGLFYFGSSGDARGFYEERLQVYDRSNLPCMICGSAIKRIVQAGRSTFYCPHCQRAKATQRLAEQQSRNQIARSVWSAPACRRF